MENFIQNKEYFKEKELFMRTAEDHTLKFAEKRPKN